MSDDLKQRAAGGFAAPHGSAARWELHYARPGWVFGHSRSYGSLDELVQNMHELADDIAMEITVRRAGLVPPNR